MFSFMNAQEKRASQTPEEIVAESARSPLTIKLDDRNFFNRLGYFFENCIVC